MSQWLRIVIAMFSLAATALGQSEVGSATLNGTVLDASGASVSGAKVTATNQATGLVRQAESSESGLYNVVRLPAGNYEISVEMQGFKTAKRTGVPLNVGSVLTLDLALEVGTAAEQVTVTAEVPVVETTRSQTSTIINEKSVRDLPINGRNFIDFALLTPAVTRDSRAGDLSFGGQRFANSLLVDGGDTNNLFFSQASGRTGAGRNPYSFSQDAVQEFQVNTAGYSAETGRAIGGVINVITKSGTNDLHGTGFWFFRDRTLNANTFINNQRGLERQPYHYNQFGGNLGGPIVKDRLFFFFNYDGQRNTNPNPVFLSVPAPPDALSQQAAAELQRYLTPYTRSLDNDVYTGKVDWNAGTNQNLSVRYNANKFKGVNYESSGSQSAFEHTGNANVTTHNMAVNYTRVFGTNKVWDSRFIYLRDAEPGEANSEAPEAVIRQNNTTVLTIGRNNYSPRYTNTKRYQTIQSLAITSGAHTWKAGLDFNFERIDNFFPGLFGGAYNFNSYADFASRAPFSFTQAFAGADTDGPLTTPNMNEYAFYGQDSWRATNRLTLNYGVRYDLFDAADPKVRNPDAVLQSMGLDTGRMNLDTNNISGRLGFAYKVLDNGRIVLRGGYGTFYGRTAGLMIGTAHSQNGIQVRTFELRSNMPTYPQVLSAAPSGGGQLPNIFVFAPDYQQPQSHQFSFNLEVEAFRGTAVTFGYLGVRGVHLSRTRDVNLFPAELVEGTLSTGETVSFRRHPGAAGPARPNPNFGRISVFDSGADSIYHGGFVQVAKRYSANIQFQTSYTFSKVIDTAPSQASVVVPFDDFFNAQDTLQPNLDRGPGEADSRHRFVFSGVWDVVYARNLDNRFARALLNGYQLSLVSTVQSGRFFSATVAGDPNNNGQTASDRPLLLGRNTLEGPGFASVDARVSRDFPLTERARLRIMVEAFNLTNRANFTAFNRGLYNFNPATRVFTPANGYLARTGTADPRILQLAARIMF